MENKELLNSSFVVSVNSSDSFDVVLKWLVSKNIFCTQSLKVAKFKASERNRICVNIESQDWSNYRYDTKLQKYKEINYPEFLELIGGKEGEKGENNGWISVKDKLPEQPKEIIVCNGKDSICCGLYQRPDSFTSVLPSGETFKYHINEFTHWQPLPKPPIT